MASRGRHERREVAPVGGDIVHLDDQQRALFAQAGVPEGGQRRAGVLARGVGIEIEERQKDEGGFGQPKAGAQPAPRGGGPLEGDGVGHRQDRHRGLGGHGFADEIAGAPDLIVKIEARHPGIGKVRQFPGKKTDVVFAGAESRAVVMIEIPRSGRIDVDHVDPIGIGFLQPVRISQVSERIAAMELERHQGRRDLGGVGRPHHAARRFSDSQVGGEKPGNVEPEAGMPPREGARERRVALREIVHGLAPGGGDAADPQLPVAILAAESLERPDAGDPSEPGQKIREASAREAQVEDRMLRMGRRSQRHAQLPGPGCRRIQPGGGGAVHEADQPRRSLLEAAGLRVRQEVAADDQRVDAVERGSRTRPSSRIQAESEANSSKKRPL